MSFHWDFPYSQSGIRWRMLNSPQFGLSDHPKSPQNARTSAISPGEDCPFIQTIARLARFSRLHFGSGHLGGIVSGEDGWGFDNPQSRMVSDTGSTGSFAA